MKCFFVTDLHGHIHRYKLLLEQIKAERPDVVLIGGDLLAGGFFSGGDEDVLHDILAGGLKEIKQNCGGYYPQVFIILGNDDPALEEKTLLDYEQEGLWTYLNNRHCHYQGYDFYGYCYVPPSPFLLKDWERYDVSRYVDIGCVAPEDGYHSVPFSREFIEHSTIQDELKQLTDAKDLSNAIFLFHAPPYQTGLDRAALDGKMIDHVPLDVHVGSIAIKNFIEERQPLVSLHGHIHESYSITGIWKENIGRTTCISAAGTGRPLTLVSFDPNDPDLAQRRELV